MSTKTNPAFGIKKITPSDSADIDVTRGLYIGTAGALKITDAAGNTVTIANATAGDHPWQIKRVYSTGTDAAVAADIHGLY